MGGSIAASTRTQKLYNWTLINDSIITGYYSNLIRLIKLILDTIIFVATSDCLPGHLTNKDGRVTDAVSAIRASEFGIRATGAVLALLGSSAWRTVYKSPLAYIIM